MSNFYKQLANLTPEQRAIFEKKLKEKGLKKTATQSGIAPRQSDENLPLSFAQQRLWFVQQLDPDNAAYNMMGVLKLSGELNITVLKQAIESVAQRHETLRTRFELNDNNEAIQIIQPDVVMDYQQHDLTAIEDKNQQQAKAHKLAEKNAFTPYDLTKPQLRVTLIKLSDQQHLIALGTHHITSDRWSFSVFIRELGILYHSLSQQQPSPLPDNRIQYADWALWQREQLQGEKLEQQLDYWRTKLAAPRAILALPTDQPRQQLPSYKGAQFAVQIPESLTEQLRSLASQHKITLFTLLLAAFKVLMHRYSDTDDVLVGSEVANRDQSETQNMMGPLVNTLVFRSDISGNPRFSDFLQQVAETVKGGMSRQDIPFEKLVEELNPERQLSQMSPLFQVKFDLQHTELKPFALDGLSIERYPLPDQNTKYELRFNLQDLQQTIGGQIEYAKDLYNESTIAALFEHFHTLLTSITTNPQQRIGELALMSPSEQEEVLYRWNQTESDFPQHSCVHQLFEQQVVKTPDAIAVIDGQQQLSYFTLNQRANQLAATLVKRGVGRSQRLGIYLPPSCSALVAMLATLKTGAAYVPMDISYPTERIAFMASDAKTRCLLTNEVYKHDLNGTGCDVICIDTLATDFNGENLSLDQSSQDQLYVVYTSGSTGQPKGAGVSHRNAVNLLHWYTREYAMDHNDRGLVISALGFDLTQKNFFALLTVGGTVVFTGRDHYDPATVVATVAQQQISLINCAPSALYPLLEHSAQDSYQPLSSLRYVLLGGEAIKTASIASWLEQTPTRLINMYGPTECTDIAATHEVTTEDLQNGSVPIGLPNANVQLYVLDDRYLTPMPAGVPGQLYIGGESVGTGYLYRDALNQQAFIDNPFSQQTQPNKLYATGDQVRRLANGELEFISRIDGQLKLRGFRIEAEEIEAQLQKLPGIKAAAVSIQNLSNAERKQHEVLAAYIVLTDNEKQADHKNPTNIKHLTELKQKWRDTLKQRLPEYMVPAVFVTLEHLPLSANGKVDRRALPAPSDDDISLDEAVAPSTEIERTLHAIWCEQLQAKGINKDTLGINHNFFDIGGHSLLAIQIIAATEAALGVSIGLRDFFQSPTIVGLAELVARKTDVKCETQDAKVREQIQPESDAQFDAFPLTDIQQAYWLGRNRAFELGNVGTHAYREFDVSGVDVAAVEWALQQLIQRHGMLRAIINNDGQQQVLPKVPDYRIALNDISTEQPDQQDKELHAIRERLSHQLFNPAQWPLFHIEAARLDDQRHRFFVSFDVLIGDAWSFQVLGRELAMLCAGQTLPALQLNFRDYVLAEQAFMQTTEYQNARNYWLQRLDDLPAAPDLPLTKSPSQIREPRFSRRSTTLPAQDWSLLKQRASQAGLTPSALILAAFSEILNRWSRKPQFTLNLTIFNRHPIHPQVNDIIGDFTASLLLGIDQSGCDSFTQRAQRLQGQLWQDLDHRAMSGVRVLRELARKHNRATSALMPVVFTSTLGQEGSADLSAAGINAERVFSVSQTSQVYLDHQVGEVDGALLFNWDAIDDLFPAGMLDDMFDTYCRFLQQLINDDNSWQHYPQLISADHFTVLNQAAAQYENVSHALLHEGFFRQAQKTPELPAILSDERSLTYAELANVSLELAEQLSARNIQPNQLVAVSLAKGWQQIAACLGILSAGGAYVPIDPQLPRERRWQLIEDTQASVVITDCKDWPDHITTINDLSGNADVEVLAGSVSRPSKRGTFLTSPHGRVHGVSGITASQDRICDTKNTDLAYVIFTSGSTGKPKGVMIDHQGAVNTIDDINRRYNITQSDRVFALSSLSFDLSVYDIFGPLAVGAAIVIPNQQQVENTAHWRGLLERYQVSVWNSVPALAQLLITELESVDSNEESSSTIKETLRLIMMSGDWIPLSLPSAIKNHLPNADVYSMGGATEASIWSIFYPIETEDNQWHSIPYGRPLTNQSWYVLDENLNPCPPWVPGQLYIGGIGVAKGYWQRQALTAERFIANPFVDQHSDQGLYLYNTGDMGRYCPANTRIGEQQGTLEFLGRDDFQVKINGYRIELGEIESLLIQQPVIDSVVVHAVGSPLQLAAYLVLNNADDQAQTLQQVRARLHEQLPAYMVPKHLLVIDEIPLTANGKVDRNALPTPNQLEQQRQIIAPATDNEQRIIHLWQSMLQQTTISMDDNFFELGGNSLIAMQMLTQLQQAFAVELDIALIFSALTPADQAELIRQTQQQVTGSNEIKTMGGIERQSRETESDILPAGAAADDLSDDDVDAMLAQLMDNASEEAPQ